MAATRIELHARNCSCKGGAWALLEETQRSPCTGADADAAEKLVVSLIEWRQAGKPACVEAYTEAQAREQSGNRREFQRFEVSLAVRVERIPSWRDPTPQGEDTFAEVIASGGALVRCRMAVEKGESVGFRLGPFASRAEVMYVSSGAGTDGFQRLGLKFLDSPLPDALIPADARPIA
jgi:hypothetical protein